LLFILLGDASFQRTDTALKISETVSHPGIARWQCLKGFRNQHANGLMSTGGLCSDLCRQRLRDAAVQLDTGH
jgi:hypothetical protein